MTHTSRQDTLTNTHNIITNNLRRNFRNMLQYRPYLIRRRVTRRSSTVSCHVCTEGLPTRIKQKKHSHRTRHLREERQKYRGDTDAESKRHMLLEKHGREKKRKVYVNDIQWKFRNKMWWFLTSASFFKI